jgi:hypothetical protein
MRDTDHENDGIMLDKDFSLRFTLFNGMESIESLSYEVEIGEQVQIEHYRSRLVLPPQDLLG